jgi:hypothetical protein
MKTCNCEGCCFYKIFGGSLLGCNYEGYCDYQTPKDSRPIVIPAIDSCICAGEIGFDGRCLICGKPKG